MSPCREAPRFPNLSHLWLRGGGAWLPVYLASKLWTKSLLSSGAAMCCARLPIPASTVPCTRTHVHTCTPSLFCHCSVRVAGHCRIHPAMNRTFCGPQATPQHLGQEEEEAGPARVSLGSSTKAPSRRARPSSPCPPQPQLLPCCLKPGHAVRRRGPEPFRKHLSPPGHP